MDIGYPAPQATKRQFVHELQASALNEGVHVSAQKVWTSEKKLKLREFSSIWSGLVWCGLSTMPGMKG